MIRDVDWKQVVFIAAGVPALVLFSMGGISATVGAPAWLVWTISVLFGFAQSFTYAEIAGLHPSKTGGTAVHGATAWIRYSKILAPLSLWSNWLAWTPVLAIGAGLPRERVGSSNGRNDVDLVKSYDFLAAIQALQLNGKSSPPAVPFERRPSDPISAHPAAYDNTLLILGAESSTFYQRVPVPIGMWQPLSHDGVPLRLAGPGVVKIDGQRVAVLICYEQILTYPILASMLQHPTVLVGISNTFWFDGTPIPRYQASAVRAWARLFGVPYLLAVNS